MTSALILGIAGTRLTPDEAGLLRDARPLGVVLFARNIVDRSQLADLVASIRAPLPGARIMVDQEGGRVARMRPPAWRAHPPAGRIGALAGRDPEAGARAAWLTGALIGADCAASGIDIAAAPVLDLQVDGADPVIGDRAFASDPALVATLGTEFASGLMAAGVQPVGKHAPGHGAAGADSHLRLPVVGGIDARALEPFAALADRIGWMMTAHVLYRDADPERPATLSRRIIEVVIRGAIGFGGVLVSDDLAMGALAGDPVARATACLEAGCDVALECAGVFRTAEALARALPELPARTAARLDRAAAAIRAARRELDPDALAAEREGLLR